MKQLEEQIAAAQQSLNNLLATRDALVAMDEWTQETPISQIIPVLNVLKLMGVTPVAVITLDGAVTIVRVDDVRPSEPIKLVRPKSGK